MTGKLSGQTVPTPVDDQDAANKSSILVQQLSLQTLYNINFVAEPNQDLIAGGAFTVGGKTIYVDNVASASKFEVSGAGLEIDCNTVASALSASARDAPIFGVRFSDLGINAMDASFVRVWGMFTHNADATFESVYASIERKQVGGFVSATYYAYHLYQYANPELRWSGYIQAHGVNSSIVPSNTTDTSDDVMMIQYNPGASYATLYTGVSSGGNFPSIDAMHRRFDLSFTTGGFLLQTDPTTELAAMIAAVASNVSGTLQTTWTRMKVEAK